MRDTPETPAAPDLTALFRPRSIAVLGASSSATKIGGLPIALLKQAGYDGDIVPVNPKAPEVQGLTAFPSLTAAGRSVDMAIVALPSALVEDAVTECISCGVRAIVMFSSGLGEVGEEGKRIEARIAQACDAAGVALLGPNSLGLFSPLTKVFATFSTSLEATWPAEGGVAIASQSGAVGSYCYAMLHARGVGISHFIATGNEAGVDVTQCIDWLADDPGTKVIAAYVEGVTDGPALIAALRKARAAGKPVIMMKVGRSNVGAAAVASHTGALAGDARVIEGVFAATGVFNAPSVGDLVDAAEAAAYGVFPGGRKLGLITVSGGAGVLMADLASDHGLEVPALPQAAQDAIRAEIPFAGPRNPVDATAQVVNDRELLTRVTRIVVEQGNYDIVALFLVHMGRNEAQMDAALPKLAALRAEHPEKLFIVCTLHEPAMRNRLREAGFLTTDEPHVAIRIAAMLARMGDTLPAPGEPGSGALTVPEGDLDEAASKAALSAAGVPFPDERTAPTPAAAAEAARAIGGPVALKILSPDILHKSDVGGVRLGLDAEEVEAAAAAMQAMVADRMPDARLTGFLVSPMISGGVECVIGSYRDPVFGPMVMLGLGGVLVEVLKDVVFRPAPVSEAGALEMIGALKASALLTETIRGRPPMDTDALAAAIVRVSRIAAENAEAVSGIELNPFLVQESGGVALDALITR